MQEVDRIIINIRYLFQMMITAFQSQMKNILLMILLDAL